MALRTATAPHLTLLRAPGGTGVHRARRALSAEVDLATRRATLDPLALQTRRERLGVILGSITRNCA